MKFLTTLAIILVATAIALAQAHDVENKDAKVKEEVQKLFADLNEAITKKDRAALERLYADEFQFIRPTGAVINKAAQIGGVMANDPLSSTPVPAPPPEHFFARETETEMTFVKNEKGQVTDVVLRLGSCQDSKAKKIE